ncbi:predicted protein [Histoplasma capsulatum G186AR]|uniref:Uncharacterized protein n=1 Tax=Ajellomyces capsulatus (strain G186AR / H82 / ATCC MYA-2454 / RMSCC 2432) TaxID=447093 RepID=C0NN57_AJECG|nr:uncharacterized protein HCBG_04184 [Histoplasma capsulatum G186AR]EEH07305.1 predicted protein [Histoplasma capsulatum G186AR]
MPSHVIRVNSQQAPPLHAGAVGTSYRDKRLAWPSLRSLAENGRLGSGSGNNRAAIPQITTVMSSRSSTVLGQVRSCGLGYGVFEPDPHNNQVICGGAVTQPSTSLHIT